jgi:hypothetical protein
MESRAGGDVLGPMTPGRRISAFLFLAVLAIPAAARAVEVHPFYARHFSPMVQAFGIPPAEDGETVPKGSVLARLVVDAANSYHSGEAPRERIRLDGETWRTTIALRYGFTPRFEAGVDVAVVNHSGGLLDGFIENFHQWIGNPKNNGLGFPRYQLNYLYDRDGAQVFRVQHDTTALGDVMLSGAWRLSSIEDNGRAVALRATLKLPTGRVTALAGSGGTDGSLRIAARDARTLARWNVTFFGAAGVLYVGKNTFVGGLRRPLVGFGTVGAGWAPLSWMAVKLQSDAHTQISREAEARPLSWAVHLMGGFTFALPAGVAMDFGIAESIVHETAPDVGFQLAFRKRFGGTP